MDFSREALMKKFITIITAPIWVPFNLGVTASLYFYHLASGRPMRVYFDNKCKCGEKK